MKAKPFPFRKHYQSGWPYRQLGAGSGGGGDTFQGAIPRDQFVAQSIVGSEILKEVSE